MSFMGASVRKNAINVLVCGGLVTAPMMREKAMASEMGRHCEERSDEAIQQFNMHKGPGLLRRACHRAGRFGGPVARNDGKKGIAFSASTRFASSPQCGMTVGHPTRKMLRSQFSTGDSTAYCKMANS
jgi:hypothetical protein